VCKIERGGPSTPFALPCSHINGKNPSAYWFTHLKTSRKKGETYLSKIGYDKDHPLLELQLSQQPHKKEQLVKPNQLD
jgi:hypothetical protein